MTSVLPEEESKVARMKQKLMNDHVKEETRSFLSFSRENLSISQSDLEQRFNKHRFRPNRNTVLSVTALIIALLCLALESWKFHCSLVNAREIDELKRNVDSLKHRFLEKDLLDQLKAFQEKLYAGESSDDDDPGEADIENAEYDSNYDYSSYDEDTFSSRADYSSDYQSSPVFGRRPSDFPDASSTIAPVPSPPQPQPSPDKTMMDLLAEMSKHGQESKRHHKTGERDRHQEKKASEGKSEEQKSASKPKRDKLSAEDTGNGSSKTISRRERSIEESGSKRLFVNRHFPRSKTRRMVTSGSGSASRETLENRSDEEKQNDTSATISSRHPPKKYYTHSSLNTGDASSVRSEESIAQTSTNRPRKLAHRLRKHMSHPRKVVAVHYHGDRNGYTKDIDDYAHNGKIRHGTSVFKAWKPSGWVDTLGMNEYFRMSDDGSVTVYETGLYLVYAQIHYNDDHDEIGFHLQVNNQPILQCTIDNSHNSRSISQTCFSAQLTPLHKEDVLVFKDVSSPRYAIFDKINSFFGMVKLGELTRPAH